MSVTKIKKGIHLHQFTAIRQDDFVHYDLFILGSVLCPLFRADQRAPDLIEICNNLRASHGSKKIYIQQPYYLSGNCAQFIDLIKDLKRNQLIDGLIINSPGILNCFENEDLEFVFSRFTVHKRKRTNRYFSSLVAGHNIKAFECFADDHDLINDLRALNEYELWLREGAGKFFSFSSYCLIQHYLNRCLNEPARCASGAFSLKDSKQDLKFILSGHFMFTATPTKMTNDSGNIASLICNASGFEL